MLAYNSDWFQALRLKTLQIICSLIHVYQSLLRKSSRNIQGQVLRILGKEYVIGTDSTNSVISLISNTEEIKLEKLENVKINSNSISGTIANIEKDSNGEVAVFEIAFNMPDNSNIKVGENAADRVFDAIKLSFNSVDANGFALASIEGKC